MGEYAGDVGEYAGDVGEYAGDVGEYAGDVGLYAGDVGEYAGLVGEYAGLVGEYAGDVGEYAGDIGLYAGDVGEYAGDVGEYAGDVGENAGDVGEYPGDAPYAPDAASVPGEKRMDSSNGLAIPAFGDNKKDGDMFPSAPRPGVTPLPGVTPAPTAPSPYATPRSRSTASFSISSFRCNPNSPVPNGQNWPSMMFSDNPLMRSLSANAAASIRMSTVSSNEQRINGPVSTRLMPCRVIDIKCPRYVITSTKIARCR